MKKIVLSTLALSLIFPLTADAKSLKPTDIKVGNKDYKAVVLKDISIQNRENYGFNSVKKPNKIKKGTKVTITKHKLIRGYNFFVLNGNRYMAVDNTSIKITGPSKTAIDYDKKHVSKYAKSLLADKNTQKQKYYNDYKKFVLNQDQQYQKWVENKENTLLMGLVGIVEPVTEEAMYILSYKDWLPNRNMKIDKNILPYKDFKKINFLSESFKKSFINSKNNIVRGHKAGESMGKIQNDYKATNRMSTSFGEFQVGSNAGYMHANRGNKAAKVMYVTSKNISYKDWVAYYGQPTSEQLTTKHRIEHILTYDKSQYGYNVKVAFSSHKGYLKYIIKEKIK